MNRIIASALLAATMAAPGAALAAGGGGYVEDVAFSYEGPFGKWDAAQLQRGFQVYHEVCAACHGMKYVSFRNLGDMPGPSFPEDQVKAIAELYEVADSEGEPGDTRPGVPADKFPANEAAGAPDLSLMAKARAGFHGPYGLGISQLVNGMGGDEYIYSLMVGYRDNPECAPDDQEGWYNIAFTAGSYPASCLDENGKHTIEGSWINMPPPLMDDIVEYQTYAAHSGDDVGELSEQPAPTMEQTSKDVSAFLMWAAEPKLVERKEAGFRNLIALIILTVLLYYTNKKIWAKVKNEG